MSAANLQLDRQGRLLHFLTVEGLTRRHLTEILDTAESLRGVAERRVKKLPTLHGKTVVNLFFEARHVKPHIAVLNAGDGCHAHPTQGMLDAFTIRRHKPDFPSLQVAIVGDILHSRVARSLIHALNILGAGEVRVIAPRTLLPVWVESLGARVFHSPKAGLREVDVIVMLRLQRERMERALLPTEQEFFQQYGLTEERLALAKPDAIVMHPGPINRGVEIDSRVADGPRSVILEQVTNGIAVRMAIMSITLGNHARPLGEDA